MPEDAFAARVRPTGPGTSPAFTQRDRVRTEMPHFSQILVVVVTLVVFIAGACGKSPLGAVCNESNDCESGRCQAAWGSTAKQCVAPCPCEGGYLCIGRICSLPCGSGECEEAGLACDGEKCVPECFEDSECLGTCLEGVCTTIETGGP